MQHLLVVTCRIYLHCRPGLMTEPQADTAASESRERERGKTQHYHHYHSHLNTEEKHGGSQELPLLE